ncbi:guanine deaminase [Polynucleobacter sp. Ross1-W9]|nr:guanine deaminase [Polynucleobacter parvulilacunae]MBU3557841.1 guanine deaminase [Polynucleobacter parvulilacunae]
MGYRGGVLYFTDNPAKTQDAYRYFEDGVLYVEGGRVLEAGNYKDLRSKYGTARIVDYSGRLIIPGFIDTHVHYPQSEMMAAYGDQLLDWLNNYTFPTERQFSDPAHASKIAKLFLDQAISNGTTTALVFATVSPVSVDAFFAESEKRNLRMISGKVLMDRNAPDYLIDTPKSGYMQSKALIEKWHNKGRLSYAVTPRFVPTSSPEQLALAGKLANDYPGVYVHTHVAENKAEVAWVQELFPERRSYLDVYDHYGLVTSHSIFAHGIYLNQQDMSVLSNKGGSIAFCPTSNLFLGSGLFNLAAANRANVKVGLGTDIGAGTSLSILETMNEAYKATQLRKAFADDPSSVKPLDPMQSLYLATLGGARALSLDDKIGWFKPGMEADFLVLGSGVTPLLDARVKNSATIADKVFAFEIMGDDRSVEHVYIMGIKAK